MTHALGRHFLLELYDCDAAVLNDVERIEGVVRKAVKKMGATLIGVASNQYSPHGVTCMALLAESHLSVHTWPEYGYAAIDIFGCGETTPELAVDALEEVFEPARTRCLKLRRGFPQSMGEPEKEPDARESLLSRSTRPH